MEETPRFEQLILPHLDAAYNLARWLLSNDHDAEDAVQEAYLRAYKAFTGFHGENGKAWLMTIVRNVCFTQLKKKSGREPAVSFDEEVHGVLEATPQSDAALLKQTNSEWLRQALEQLPTDFREVIVMHELEDMPYKEIAAVVGVPIGTVMSRLARARKRLQQALLELARKESSHGL